MKRTIRILALVLASLMVLAVLASCGKPADDPEKKPEQTGENDPQTEDPLKDTVPENLELNEEYTILHWNSPKDQFGLTAADSSASLISAAIYARDQIVKDRLKVTFNYHEELGDVANFADHFNPAVQNAFMSGTPYDIVAGYPRAMGMLSLNGYFKNLRSIPGSYLNFSKAWWPSDLIDELTIGESLFFVSGDITPSLEEMIYCLFYNADYFSELKIKDPYECVQDGTWTLETLYTDIAQVTGDLSGDEGYGLCSVYFSVTTLIHGCGIRLVECNEDDLIKLSDTCYSQKAIEIVDGLADRANETYFVCNEAVNFRTTFYAGDAMFIITETGDAITMSDNSEINFNYSVVPAPKYDELQERYYSTLRQPVSFFATMSGNDDARMKEISAILELLAAEGYKKIRPQVVESGLKKRNSNSEEMREMMTLVLDTVTFDAGRIYSSSENSYLCDLPGRTIEAGESGTNTSWATSKASNEERIAKQFKKMADTFMKLEMAE